MFIGIWWRLPSPSPSLFPLFGCFRHPPGHHLAATIRPIAGLCLQATSAKAQGERLLLTDGRPPGMRKLIVLRYLDVPTGRDAKQTLLVRFFVLDYLDMWGYYQLIIPH